MKNAQTALLVLVTVGAIASVLTLVFTMKGDQLNASGWDTFTSANGDFQFQKPEEVSVNCKDDVCTLTSPTETNPQPVPDMTITVKEGEVTFLTWENFEIPYFNQLVSSFEFKN